MWVLIHKKLKDEMRVTKFNIDDEGMVKFKPSRHESLKGAEKELAKGFKMLCL